MKKDTYCSHCANDFPHSGCYKNLRRFTVWGSTLLSLSDSPSFFIPHKGRPLSNTFSYRKAVILSKKSAVVFLYISQTD